MRVVAGRIVQALWVDGYPDAERPLPAWFNKTHKADSKTTTDINARYAHARIVDAEPAVFNTGGRSSCPGRRRLRGGLI